MLQINLKLYLLIINMILPIIAFVTYFLLLKYLKVPLHLQIENRNKTVSYLPCDEPLCL